MPVNLIEPDKSYMGWQPTHDLVSKVMIGLGLNPDDCPAEGWKVCHRIAIQAYRQGVKDTIQEARNEG